MIADVLAAAQEVVNNYGQHMGQEDFCALAKDMNSQLTKAIIREHEMKSLEADHPALKELREKLSMMTTLLERRDNT